MPDGVILNFAGIDARHIKAVNLVFPEQNFERRLVLKRLFKNRPALPELYLEDKEAFFPFINEYGQYKHAIWEGKITDDSQFAEAIIKEEKYLQAHLQRTRLKSGYYCFLTTGVWPDYQNKSCF